MENNCLPQSFSNACPPVYAEDYSLFFNLILGTKFENSKDNCLQFLRNYSKNIFLPKRQLFMFLINELTLNKINDNSSKGLGNNESIYLIRQLIKKYSRNNIINALYDFISFDDNEFIPPANDNILINSTFDSSMNPLQSSQSERDSKFENSYLGIIQENQSEENNKNNDNDNENEKKNYQFLSRKRKLHNSPKINNKNKAKSNQNSKKRKKFKKIKNSKKISEKLKEKKDEDIQKDNEKKEIEKNIEEEQQKEEDENQRDNEEEKEEEKEESEKEKDSKDNRKKKIKKEENESKEEKDNEEKE